MHKLSKAWIAFIGLILAIAIIAVLIIITAMNGSSGAASLYTIPNIPVNPRPMQVCITSGSRRTAPWIKITSPNGGESYQPGQQVAVTWTTCNIPTNGVGSINISLTNYQNNWNDSLATNLSNTGSTTVTLPSSSTQGFVPGSEYKITVGLVPGYSEVNVNSSSSNNYFAIGSNGILVSSNGAPTAVVNSPTGSNNNQSIDFQVPFSVTAIGQTAYVHVHDSLSTGPTISSQMSTPNMQYAIENGESFVSSLGASSMIASTSPLQADANGNYEIAAGTTQNFVLTVTYAPSAAGQYRAMLTDVPWSSVDATTFTGNQATGFAHYPSSFLDSNTGFQTPSVDAQ
jgi:hypothetical protein